MVTKNTSPESLRLEMNKTIDLIAAENDLSDTTCRLFEAGMLPNPTLTVISKLSVAYGMTINAVADWCRSRSAASAEKRK